ncbi:hypothetical protein KAR52_02815 [Candidatus Pacearchaeota archaeon]|nr:hypothetical protein [Candidatus Pacearchaeota archaeon]
MATIQQIIGKVNPKVYSKNGAELLKKYGSADKIPAEEIEPKPLAEHTLVYDSSSETLEPVYFFILDLMNDFGLAPKKYADTFSSTPGSGHFAELGQRGTIMQQQGAKILGDINTVLRSVLNIVYDLKEFRIRLQNYEDLKSDNKESALLSLKQIWMDKVDIAKGNSSIKAMAMGQVGFQTLMDAFLVAKDVKDVSKIDLNDRVRRILLPRVREFNIWVEQSGKELQKRYEIERIYLGSQVNSLKLYSRWAKPYLRAAQELEMKEMKREPALVKTFNTILLELTLLGKSKIKIGDAAIGDKLSAELQKLKTKRDYFSCILVDFKFRGIPQKVSQQPHYLFGGKAEITFRAYALNSEELQKIEEELEQSDVEDVLRLIEGTTTESLKQLQDEINFFLEEKTEDVKENKSKDSSNPFFALIGRYESKNSSADKTAKKLSEKTKKIGPIKSDNFIESEYIRPFAVENAIDTNFNLFDIYKKAHGMPSYT